MNKFFLVTIIGILAFVSCKSGNDGKGLENIDYNYQLVEQRIHNGWNTTRKYCYLNVQDGSFLPLENIYSGTPFTDDYALVWTKDPESKEYLLNYYDKQCHILENKYTSNMVSATVFSENRAWIVPKGCYPVLIDKEGNRIEIDIRLQEVYPFNNGVCLGCNQEGQALIIGLDGKCVKNLGNMYIPVFPTFINGILLVRKTDGLFGALDTKGNEIISCEWGSFLYNYQKPDDIYTYLDIAKWLNKGFIRVQSTGGWGCIDLKGKVVVEPQNASIDIEGDWFRVQESKDNWTSEVVWLNHSGKLMYGPITKAERFGDGPIMPIPSPSSSSKYSSKYGYVNRQGKVITDFEFEQAYSFGDSGYAHAIKNNEDYLIDKNGKSTLLKIGNWTLLDIVHMPNRFWVVNGEYRTLINEKGEPFFEPGDYNICNISTYLSRAQICKYHKVGIISAAITDADD